MFKGFKLEQVTFKSSRYYDIGREVYDNHKLHVKKSLESFVLSDKSLDGSKIIASWFPQIKANVFISHSHNDEKYAISFAGWLYDNFKIVAFIDSCIWGHSNHLIKLLDDNYSWLDRDAKIYDYQKVLYSTSHVHMMLSTALEMMIYKTECLIFFDTPHSVKSYEKIDKTESPWIYSELAFSQIGKQTIPERLKKVVSESKYFSADGGEVLEKALKIKYDLNSKHLTPINAETLNLWIKYPNLNNAEDALDMLYEIALPNKRTFKING
jgi:hypothetical protein